MGALIFRCPTTHRTFRSNFKVTSEELKNLPRSASMTLRCDVCRERHLFVLSECTIDEEKG